MPLLRRRPFRWLAGLGAIAVVVIAVFRYVEMKHSRVEQLVCHSVLKGIAMSMHDYHAVHGSLPPGYIQDSEGARMHSWRVLVASYTGIGELQGYDFTQPWNSATNSRWAERPWAELFACPSDNATQIDRRLTNYFVVEGENTAFPGAGTTTFQAIRESRGLANVLLVAEAVELNVQWLEPRDLAFSRAALGINLPDGPGSISSWHPEGPIVVMADGSVRTIGNISPDVLRAMLQVNDGATEKRAGVATD